MKSFVAVIAMTAFAAGEKVCSKMPENATKYAVKGVTDPVTPDSSLNGNWVLYGIPDTFSGAK